MIYVSSGFTVFFSIIFSIATLITFPIALAALTYPECYYLQNLNFTKKGIRNDILLVSGIFLLSWFCIALAGNFMELSFSDGEVVKEEKLYLYNEVSTKTNKNMVLYEGKKENEADGFYALIIKNENNEEEILTLNPGNTQIKYDNEAVTPYILKKYFRHDHWIFYTTSYDYLIYFPKSFRSEEE